MRLIDFLKENKDRSEKELFIRFCLYQEKEYSMNGSCEGLVGFVSDAGVFVVCPLFEESMRFGVDPEAYYGKENIDRFKVDMKNEFRKALKRNLREAEDLIKVYSPGLDKRIGDAVKEFNREADKENSRGSDNYAR